MNPIAKLLAIPSRLKAHLQFRYRFIEVQEQYRSSTEYLKRRYYELRDGDPGRPIRVVFLVHFLPGWNKSVYEACRNDDRFEVMIVTAPQKQPQMYDDWRDGDKNFEYFEQRGMKPVRGYIEEEDRWVELLEFEPDVIFLQTPSDGQRWSNHSSERLGAIARLCYVNYAFQVTGSETSSGWTMGPFFERCWRIFVETDYHRSLFRELGDPSKVITSGYPKLDAYEMSINKENTFWKLDKEKQPDVKRVIWAPHWTIRERYGYHLSTFTWYNRFFIEFVRENPHIDFLCRPHPLLLPELVTSGIMSQRELDSYCNEFESLPNTTLDLSGQYIDTFRTSDLLITDASSFLAMYMPTENPVILTARDDTFSKVLNDFGQAVVKNYYIANNLEELKGTLERVLLQGDDYLRERRLQDLKETIAVPAGGAGNFIKNCILEGFGYTN